MNRNVALAHSIEYECGFNPFQRENSMNRNAALAHSRKGFNPLKKLIQNNTALAKTTTTNEQHIRHNKKYSKHHVARHRLEWRCTTH